MLWLQKARRHVFPVKKGKQCFVLEFFTALSLWYTAKLFGPLFPLIKTACKECEIKNNSAVKTLHCLWSSSRSLLCPGDQTSILRPKPGLHLHFRPPHSPKPFLLFLVAAPVPAWLHCLPSVWCCDKGPHGSRNDTVSPSPSRCSDTDCLNSILSRGRVPWQLHKYLPAAATPLRLTGARLQASSAMFFFCPFFPLLSLPTVVCVVLMISFGCCWFFLKCFY